MDGSGDAVWRQLPRDRPPPNHITSATPGVGNSCRETAKTLAPPPRSLPQTPIFGLVGVFCDEGWRQLSRDSQPPTQIPETTPGIGNSCRGTARTQTPIGGWAL